MRSLKGHFIPKKMKIIHDHLLIYDHLLTFMSLQTRMSFFILWKANEDGWIFRQADRLTLNSSSFEFKIAILHSVFQLNSNSGIELECRSHSEFPCEQRSALHEETEVVNQASASVRNSVMANLFNRYICSQTGSWRERSDAETGHETLMHFCCANKRSRNTLIHSSLAASSKTCCFNGGLYS